MNEWLTFQMGIIRFVYSHRKMTIIFIFVCAFAVYRIIVETNEANYLQNTQIVRPFCGFSVHLTFVLFFFWWFL